VAFPNIGIHHDQAGKGGGGAWNFKVRGGNNRSGDPVESFDGCITLYLYTHVRYEPLGHIHPVAQKERQIAGKGIESTK